VHTRSLSRLEPLPHHPHESEQHSSWVSNWSKSWSARHYRAACQTLVKQLNVNFWAGSVLAIHLDRSIVSCTRCFTLLPFPRRLLQTKTLPRNCALFAEGGNPGSFSVPIGMPGCCRRPTNPKELTVISRAAVHLPSARDPIGPGFDRAGDFTRHIYTGVLGRLWACIPAMTNAASRPSRRLLNELDLEDFAAFQKLCKRMQ